ncbi:MAG: undecaprenyl-phosphate glucose phosphotransferase [Rhodopila sp.]|jgi:Undecaprenyl-phosphate glucose phosphotransferase
MTSDIVIVAALAIILQTLKNHTPELSYAYCNVVAFGTTLFSYATLLQRGYDFSSILCGGKQTRAAMTSSLAMFLLVIVVLFFSKTTDELSRAWVIGWPLAVGIVLGAERLLLARFLAAWQQAGGFAPKIAIVGLGLRSRQLAARISSKLGTEADVCGWFSALPYLAGDTRQHSADDGWRVGGCVDDLIKICERSPLDEVIVVVPDHPAPEIDEALRKLSCVPVSVGLCPEGLLGYQFGRHGAKVVAGVAVLNLYDRPLDGAEFFLKRIVDVAIAAGVLLFIFPLLAIIAVTIKLDSGGPILFKQKRLGFNNRIISIYKFRSMRHEEFPNPTVPQATRDDRRITRVGHFLRRTSLDELPQLFNVLSGGMSLVGPRPHALEHNEKYAREIDRYLARHRVKPGITGLAQVNGLRGETRDPRKMEMRVEYDLYYIENWSFLLDLKILIRTLIVGFRHPNAF